MIEEKTTYAYKLKYQEDLSFDKIMSFTRNLINDLPQQLVDDMYDMLDRGVVQIDTEPQMLVYIYSFGKMHKAKLDCAFAHLPEDFLQQPEINIIDYGCGQAIGTMCYVDFLKEEGIIQNIRKVTLIEPSETCLKRAALHTSVFLPEAEITTVNKTFDKLLMTDIETDENIPTLHILSNVLDLKFNLYRFAVVINEHIKGYNQFVCVGPYFSYSDKDERISKFCSLINGKENFSKVYDKYELNPDKPWTAHIKLFSIGIISTESTEKDIKNRIIEALINDDDLPIYATKYDDIVYFNVDSKRIYCREKDLETATKDNEIILSSLNDGNNYVLSFGGKKKRTFVLDIKMESKNGIMEAKVNQALMNGVDLYASKRNSGIVYFNVDSKRIYCREEKLEAATRENYIISFLLSPFYDNYWLDIERKKKNTFVLDLKLEAKNGTMEAKISEALMNGVELYSPQDGFVYFNVNSKRIYCREEELEAATKHDEIILSESDNFYWISFGRKKKHTSVLGLKMEAKYGTMETKISEALMNGVDIYDYSERKGVVYFNVDSKRIYCRETELDVATKDDEIILSELNNGYWISFKRKK